MRLSEIITVSGLFLTLITFLFNLVWPKIIEALNQDESIDGKKAIERCRNKIKMTAWKNVFPILMAFLVLFYVNLPTAIKIIKNSKIALWNFDVDDTLYIMVVIALFVFIILNAYLLIKLLCKQGKFKKLTSSS